MDEEFLRLVDKYVVPFAGTHTSVYIVMQREKAPTTGHDHLQGMLHSDKAITFDNAKELLSAKAYLKDVKGHVGRVLCYVTKDKSRCGGPWYMGVKQCYVDKLKSQYFGHNQLRLFAGLDTSLSSVVERVGEFMSNGHQDTCVCNACEKLRSEHNKAVC